MKESLPKFPNREKPAAPRGLSRRRMMQRMLGTAGAGLAWPGFSAAHPASRPGMGRSTTGATVATGMDSAWQPVFFDPHQNETVIALAERIVPNSTQAQVNRFIDTLISVDTQENQKRFLAALGAFDHEAIPCYNHPFTELSEEQQNAILAEASTAKPSGAEPSGRRRRRPAVPEPSSPEPALTLRDHFENLKGWVIRAFYSSECGMKELGWTGQVAWDSLPGCPHPLGHR